MSTMTKQPKVDGRAVTVRVDEEQMSWVHGSAEDHDAPWTRVPFKHIVAVIAASAEATGDYTMIWTQPNDSATAGDAKASTHAPRFASIQDFPDSLIDNYQPRVSSIGHSLATNTNTISDINIIVSTGSGTGLASAVWEQLVKPIFMRTGLSEDRYTVHETTSAESVAQLAQSVILPIANDGRQQLVVLLSGDGGVVDLVNTLVTASRAAGYRKPTIALLPLGTGNALASSAVVANVETLGLRTLLCGLPRQLPLFRATFSPGAKLLVNEGREEQPLQAVYHGSPATYGAVVCSWGLHATLVADSDTAEYRKFGAERFKMAANESLFPAGESMPHAYQGQVSILRTGEKAEWERVSRSEHGYILATLVSNLEAAFTISPSSRPLDGQLRLVHFAHVSGKEAMEIMMEAYQAGKHVEKARVGYEEIEAVKIEFHEGEGRWRRVCVDGKIVRVEKDGWVEVRKETENAVVNLVARLQS